MAYTRCRYFNGYKPCGKNDECSSLCEQKQEVGARILIIHLEALGAVLRATSILESVHQKYPNCHITWITKKPADQLLQNNLLIDRVMCLSFEDVLNLKALKFDVCICIDKSQIATSIANQVYADEYYGFKLDPNTAAILPANPDAEELWSLGLSNHQKFFVNQKPETQLMIEAFALGEFKRSEYILNLSKEEQQQVLTRKKLYRSNEKNILIGINTGCSSVIPYKKLSIQGHQKLIQELNKISNIQIVLLGGREDDERNRIIAQNQDVILSPTDLGLRDGIVSVAACDLVISGDSLGMHIAIALKKYVIAWFGPTCAQEIDLYNRGAKVLSKAQCSPCWKRSCQKELMCYDLVDIFEISNLVRIYCEEYINESNIKEPQHEANFNSTDCLFR